MTGGSRLNGLHIYHHHHQHHEDSEHARLLNGSVNGSPPEAVVMNNHNNSNHSRSSSSPPLNNSVKHRRRKHSGPPVRPTCHECGKDFSNQSALSKHKLTHSDVRRFACQLCGKAFKRQDHLNGHMLTHRDKKPYECDVEGCEKTYCDARSLRRHKENHHNSLTTSSINGNKLLVGQPSSEQRWCPSLAASSLAGLNLGSSSSTGASGHHPLPTQHLLRILTSNSVAEASVPCNSSSSQQFQSLNNHHQHEPLTPHATASLPSTPIEVSEPYPPPSYGNNNNNQASQSQQQQFFTYPSQPYHSHNSSTNGLHLSQQQEPTTPCSVYSQPQSSPYDLHQPPGHLSHQQHPNAPQTPHTPTTPIPNGCEIHGTSSSMTLAPPPTASMSHHERVHEYLQYQLQDNNRRPVSLPSTPIDVVGSASADTHDQVFTYPSQPYQSSMQNHNRHHLSVQQQEPTTPCSVYSQPQTSPYNLHLTPNPVQEDQMSAARRAASLPATPVDHQTFSYHQQQQQQQQQGRNYPPPEPSPCSAYSEISPYEAQHPPPHLQQVAYMPRSFPPGNYSNGKTIRSTEQVSNMSCIPQNDYHRHDSENSDEQEDSVPVDTHQLSPQDVEEFLRDIEKDYLKSSSTSSSSQVNPNNGSRLLPNERRGFFPSHHQTYPGKLQQQHQQHLASSSTANLIASKSIPQTTSQSLGKNISNSSSSSSHHRMDNTVSVVVSSKTAAFPLTGPVSNFNDDNNNDKSSNLEVNLSLKATSVVNRGKSMNNETPASKPNISSTVINGKPSGKHACSSASTSSSNTSSTTNNSVIKVSSPKRMRHKPEPLYIPPHVNACGSSSGHYSYHQHQSRLRSPRLWDGKVPSQSSSHLNNSSYHGPLGLPPPPPALNGLSSTSSSHSFHPYLHHNHMSSYLHPREVPGGSATDSSLGLFNRHLSGHVSPPPYTPPPMLSPVRTGSGLYWHILPSGSLTPKTSLHHHFLHRDLLLKEQQLREHHLLNGSSSADTAKEEEAKMTTVVSQGGHFFRGLSTGILSNDVMPAVDASTAAVMAEVSAPTPKTAYEPDTDFQSIPETDIQPHVNVGAQFQARIPEFNPVKESALDKYRDERADLIWDPKIMKECSLSDDDIDSYLQVACSSCVPGIGRNLEYAFHVLSRCRGDLKQALLQLMLSDPVIPETDPLYDYHYPEADVWSTDEISSYHQALVKCDKDFNAIAKEVQTKSVKQCIQFYYLWKKVCPDEYKRLRIIRRKREQEGIFYKRDNNNCEEVVNRNHSDPLMSVDDFIVKEECKSTNDEVNSDRTTPATTAPLDSDRDEEMSNDSRGISPSPSSVGSVGTTSSTEYPCKVCGKVFYKLKSRGAHMKIHGKQQ